MPSSQPYRVIGKAHRRMTIVDQWAVALDGTRMQIRQNGPMELFPVGSIITDITPQELSAFPDRFVPASAAELAAQLAAHAHTEHMAEVTSAAEDAYAEKLAVVQTEHAAVLAKLQAEHAEHMATMVAEKDAHIAEAEAKLSLATEPPSGPVARSASARQTHVPEPPEPSSGPGASGRTPR